MSGQRHYKKGCVTGKGLKTHWVPVESNCGNGANSHAVMTRDLLDVRQKIQDFMGASKACTAAEPNTHQSQQPLWGAVA